MAKTVLLSVHPRARHSSQARELSEDRASAWTPYPQVVLDALAVGELPADLYVWVAVLDPVAGETDPNFDSVQLCTTSRGDGLGGTGRSHLLAESMDDGWLLAMQVAYAPLHELAHPFEPSGFVTQLWPNVPADLNIEKHARLRFDTQLGKAFRYSGIGVGLALFERLPTDGPKLWGFS